MTNANTSLARQLQAERAEAREAIYRLAAVVLGYPLAETQQALEEGRLQMALDQAWQTLGGEPWPEFDISESLEQLEVGYMSTFIQGRRGKPRVPLVASAYAGLVDGLTPGAYLLNVQAFYTHFGLTAAVSDEGHKDEPDHLVAMLEFCALLCHLESRALANDRDAAPYRRAQRDFLARYLAPLLQAIRASYAKESHHGLDPNLEHLVEMLPAWANAQLLSLETLVGPSPKPGEERAAPANQSMWD
ncbi:MULTISPECIES: molecular chaperone TorD family protein [Pseudomonadota]|jgi:DMSO reductase family type II enzyme chaperone|uniref:Molecular chaperone TorD family protein n=1 Tax=Shewanella indica TaxID=768528 RepID=A0ABU4QGN4_9GAMM|nr:MULTISPECIES: molecular chaperone TorD family protein [Pseudomonadota]MBS68956.1 protein DdhD [Pseudomonas sp.]MCS7748824.1 molecular chaperone TorD family protein [Pseudomonas aeruginosa]PLX77023.1 MAG: protein DdhD [Azoarcus sp.]TVT57577.1 MAG: protein DdhD [Azoarcus sp. PHD]MCS9649588.1 molecular chaperone TorD family protein [Pseudomonas aeruginosa]|tara:strand:- start:5341 stop:6078 length:738 start_codon:yes stop_codon:yes gene_type:complete